MVYANKQKWFGFESCFTEPWESAIYLKCADQYLIMLLSASIRDELDTLLDC